jgi:hypothetical protein
MQPKLFVTLILIFSGLLSSAQFEKRMIMAGSSVSSAMVSGGKTDYTAPNATPSTVNNTNINVSITPSLGWFINSKTVIGGSLLLTYNRQKQSHTVNGTTDRKDNSNNTDFGIGGFLRYYLGDASGVKPFLHAYLNGGSGSGSTDGVSYSTVEKSTYKGDVSDKFFYNAGLNLGITRMFSPSAGLDIFAGYGYSHTKFHQRIDYVYDYTNPSMPDLTGYSEYDQKFSGHALNIGIGFQVFISKRK